MAAVIATVYLALTALLFLFLYWQTAVGETSRVDHLLERDAAILAAESPRDLERAVEERLAADFHRIVIAALFDGAGHPLLGNLMQVPTGVPHDGLAHGTRLCCSPATSEPLRMVLRPLSDGRLLAIGRNIDSLTDLRASVARALAWGGIPSVILSLLAGVMLGYRTQRQMAAVQTAVARIIRGNLHERLPASDRGGDIDRVVNSVNRMLDGITQLVDQLKSAGQDIAHDLRRPLTHVRLRLEQACQGSGSHEELREMVDRAILGLDQALQITTILLRLGQIDSGSGRDRFGSFALGDAVKEIAEFYAPVAEEKRVQFSCRIINNAVIFGDRDLLLEAMANLLDNAIKFTPPGGQAKIEVLRAGECPVIRVTDSGPGIAEEERSRVIQRFYRSPRTAGIPGTGLGLCLVDGIVRLHGFQLVIRDAQPGCVIDLICVAISESEQLNSRNNNGSSRNT